MKVGTLCYATDQGLGILAKSFYDSGVVTDAMVVRHGRHPTHDEWYPGSEQVTNLRDPQQIRRMERFCASMDVVLFFETPFHWDLMRHCKRSVLMPMHECTPERLPATPDLFLCPSHLDHRIFGGVHIPVPVEVPWRKRERAEVFVHNAGHGGLKGRNGTQELLEALRYVESEGVKLVLRSQESLPTFRNYEVEVVQQIGTIPYEELWQEGDAFVFPEKFNGLSLPLQEARAAGMLVVCGDRYPMNQWLPTEPLIPVASYKQNRIGPPYMPFDEAVFDPKAIAAKIDELYGTDISEYSESGREWAQAHSWAALKPKYMEALACAS